MSSHSKSVHANNHAQLVSTLAGLETLVLLGAFHINAGMFDHCCLKERVEPFKLPTLALEVIMCSSILTSR